MGLSLSSLWNLWSYRDVRVTLIGLDGAGKTSIINKLNLGEVKDTIPTIGFNVEKVTYKNLNMNIFDVGGQERLRRVWSQYFEGASAVIFAVDSCDKARLADAANELHKAFESPHLANASLLVYANKQDLPGALPVSEVRQALNLTKLEGNRKVFVQGSSAIKGQGLYEGLDWLASNLPPQTA
jgi:small GTP-binding protein